MCDTSDGLLADAGHVAADSGVVLDLDRAVLRETFVVGPLPQVAAALGGDPLAWVLTGGEDHALVATFPPGVALPAGWTTIGCVHEATGKGPGVRVDGVPAAQVAAELGERTGHVHFG
jgi:thiamine-monophosphate kinase